MNSDDCFVYCVVDTQVLSRQQEQQIFPKVVITIGERERDESAVNTGALAVDQVIQSR